MRWFRYTLVLSVLLVPWAAQAVKYMSLEQAVMTFLPKGAKITKVVKTVSAEQKQRLIDDYGWTPAKDTFEFYVGRDEQGAAQAYVMIVPENFGTCFHKFAIGLKPDGEVIDAVVVELSCPRAMPINKKSFLKQFRGKRHVDPLTIRSDVDAVTGATLSSESTCLAARKAVSLHNLFFGGAQQSGISEEVRQARQEGEARIQKAVQSGELNEKAKSP